VSLHATRQFYHHLPCGQLRLAASDDFPTNTRQLAAFERPNSLAGSELDTFFTCSRGRLVLLIASHRSGVNAHYDPYFKTCCPVVPIPFGDQNTTRLLPFALRATEGFFGFPSPQCRLPLNCRSPSAACLGLSPTPSSPEGNASMRPTTR